MTIADAHEYRLVYVTFPDAEVAQNVARTLVQQRLAACCLVAPSPVLSVYWWQDTIEQSTEIQLSIKTHQRLLSRVQSVIVSLHPYSVPEIISIPLAESSADYEAWMRSVLAEE